MNNLKPIETFYNGHRFRSRLEARWAVFFDAAGIDYLYEPEGFVLSNGAFYLPDFYLPNVESRFGKGLWVEVKSGRPDEDLSKVRQFAQDGNQVALLYPFENYENIYLYPDEDGCEDLPFYFFKCPYCGVITYEYPNDYEHHKPDCDKEYYENCKKAEELISYITSDHNITMDMDDVDQLVHLLHQFTYRFHNHSCDLKEAIRKAKQARFEHGECG